MAGGDFALIKSVESFEDRVDYGERQLLELGFGPHDLLISPTEGGETPFVIGATNLASKISSRTPYFLYCNPDELLAPIKRSQEVIENSNIYKVNLTVGPMAISGSTRMQASTVLMLAIGVGLLYRHNNKEDFEKFFQDFLTQLTKTDYGVMKELTSMEADLYKQKKFLNYVADPHLGISILTDTTERSPTFSLRAFENRLDHGNQHSLSYLFIEDAQDAGHGWSELLWRKPRALEWSELDNRIGISKVLGFDISSHGLKARSSEIPTVDFIVSYDQGKIQFRCLEKNLEFNWGHDQLFNHLMVKMLLNAHSTLVMGLLDRYEGNVMTWVRPSNNKLVDRAARYILQLLSKKGRVASYEEVVLKIFEEAEGITENEPIVIKVLNRF
jgi:N-acetylmuramic acid 6-phosphate etherase